MPAVKRTQPDQEMEMSSVASERLQAGGSGHQGGENGKLVNQDATVSATSSYGNSRSVTSAATTKATGVSPMRAGRQREPPPPIPKRADFGDHYPDGGWGWVVCGAAFTVHFLAHGLLLAFGTTLMEIVSTFHTSPTQTVWLGSSGLGTALLLSPLVIALCRRKSPRLLAVVGGLITALGCLFVSFSTQLHQLFISYTLVVGLGVGVSLSTASLIVGRYFYKRRECAEMLILSGSGVGMALISAYLKQILGILQWMRGLQSLTGLMLPLVVAGALYRSAALYHPRRRAILHIKNLRKTKKQQREFEDKPPYFDFSPLRMRSLQVLMAASALTSLGTFTPFALLGLEISLAVRPTEACLLMVFLGVAFGFGSLLFGMVVIRSSLRCMIARQYLCQMTAFGCGFTTLLLPLVQGFNGYAVYVWSYGLLCGGYLYTLKVYTFEIVSFKLSERSWGYIGLAQSVPIVIGAPISMYLNSAATLPDRSGFIFAGVVMVTGSLILSLMSWAGCHHSNHAVIQDAHFKAKMFEDDALFYGMEISDEATSKPLNNYPYIYSSPILYKGRPPAMTRHNKLGKIKLYTNVKHNLSNISEEEHWSDIEAMSPMSPTDKVTEFLIQSHTMLRNYSQLRNLDLPGVRLEINNEYDSGDKSLDQVTQSEIKDIKIEATICRTSPRKKSTSGKNMSRSQSEPEIWQKKENNSMEVFFKKRQSVCADMAGNYSTKSRRVIVNNTQRTTPV